jgi:fatty acid desaturase
MPAEGDFRIPSRLNLLLTWLVFGTAIGLLKLASTENGATSGLAAIAFAYLLLTNYSLAHEAAHAKLQPGARANYWLGLLPATVFPMSLTLLMNSHERHHQQNRGAFEQFDCFGPKDSRPLKYGVWYGILLGIFGLYPPVWTVVLAVVPLSWIRRTVAMTRSTRAYASTLTDREIWRIRGELLLIIAFFTVLTVVVGISPSVLLFCYGLALFNWSTRQFVEHAYTSLDNIEGAFDLRHFSWMSFLMLHRELDLSHHRRPEVPWCYLPDLARTEQQPMSYLRQYLRMWRGPVPMESLPRPHNDDAPGRQSAGQHRMTSNHRPNCLAALK